MTRHKKSSLIWCITLMLVASLLPAYGKARVICEIEVLSEQSAYVRLKWSEPGVNEPIQITGWQLDGDTLVISYKTGPNAAEGFDSRKVEGTNYSFPMKVMLVENSNANPLSDLPQDKQFKESILNLYYRGIISGYPDGTFKPKQSVSRAEFAKLVTLSASYDLIESSKVTFSDVADNHWAKSYINTLSDKGILYGKKAGIFDPSGNITLGEIIAVIDRTFTFYSDGGSPYPKLQSEHWSNENFLNLVSSGIIIPTDDFYNEYKPNSLATREQCALLLSRALTKLHEVK